MSENNGKEVVKSSSALSPFGTREEVRELMVRMQTMLPGGMKLNKGEITALAQASVAHGLDPLNGEIWIIPGRGVMIGVKGLRKKARQQVQGNFWIDFREITDPDTMQRWGVPDKALAFEARLFDTENIRTYVETVERMTKAGIPWDGVKGMLGERPYTTGIGFVNTGEPTKMSRVQCAMKRAEADALKRRFDVPFGLSVESDTDEVVYGGDWSPGVIEGTATEAVVDKVPPPELSPTQKEFARQQVEAGRQALFGETPGDNAKWVTAMLEIKATEAHIRAALHTPKVSEWLKADPARTLEDAIGLVAQAVGDF